MVNSIWTSVGFDDDFQKTLDQIDKDKVLSLNDPAGFDYIAAYVDPSGVTLSLFAADGESTQETLTLHNPSPATVEAFQVTPGMAVVDLLDADGELFSRFLTMVDDPQMYPVYSLQSIGKCPRYDQYQIGAIAQDVRVYDSVAEWEEHSRVSNPEGLRIGPKFIASPGLFALHAGDASAEDINSLAAFVAVCDQVETVTNHVTGQEWYRIKADCGFSCTLALPIDAPTAPRTGSVVDGNVFLTGTTGLWQPADRQQ